LYLRGKEDTLAKPLGVYSVVYLQDDILHQAQVVARTDDQAVQVLWQAIVDEVPLIGPSQSPIDVQTIERLAERHQMPFPEAVPDHPAVTTVVQFKRGQE
jgi:hypothetical protein